MSACEEPSPARQVDCFFSDVGRSPHIYEALEEDWPPLYKISSLLQIYSQRVGYPELILNPPERHAHSNIVDEYAVIKFGRDVGFPGVYLWQVSLRKDDERALLHARSAKSGESWRYVKFDQQHAKTSTNVDSTSESITSFIVRNFMQLEVIEAVEEVFASHTAEGKPTRLNSTGIANISSARIATVTRDGRKLQATIRLAELPEWITGYLEKPIEAVELRRGKS